MRTKYIPNVVVGLFFMVLIAAPSWAQEGPTNLQVFPKETTREQVTAQMRHFAFALNVRCTHCHVRREGGGGMDFASDSNPNKETARAMMRMVETINNDLLAAIPNRDDPPVVVTCKTCHRGTVKPRVLGQELLLAAHKGGAEAAVAKFNELQENFGDVGAYDFREWETNTVAERLSDEGNHHDALIIYQMNLERFPESPSIWFGIAEQHEALGDLVKAIEALEKSAALDPRNRETAAKLKELKGI